MATMTTALTLAKRSRGRKPGTCHAMLCLRASHGHSDIAANFDYALARACNALRTTRTLNLGALEAQHACKPNTWVSLRAAAFPPLLDYDMERS